MKNLKFNPIRLLLYNLCVVMAVSFVIYACSDSSADNNTIPPNSVSYRCLNCKTEPEAKPENDNIFQGIYIGINTVGSIVVNISNNDESLTSTMMVNGTKVEFIAKTLTADKNNFMGKFYGVYNNYPVTFNFFVNGFGKNPRIESNDFKEVFNIKKETSDSMIEVFEGVYTVKEKLTNNYGDKIGIINDTLDDSVLLYIIGRQNLIISRYKTNNPTWTGITQINKNITYLRGVIKSNQLIDEKNNIIGILTNDEIKNVFFYEDHRKVYLSSYRIM